MTDDSNSQMGIIRFYNCVVTTTNDQEIRTSIIPHIIKNSDVEAFEDASRNQAPEIVEDTAGNPNSEIIENEIFLSVIGSNVTNNNSISLTDNDDIDTSKNSNEIEGEIETAAARNPNTNISVENKMVFSIIDEKQCEEASANVNDDISIADTTSPQSESENNGVRKHQNEKTKSLPRRGTRLARCSAYNVFFQDYRTSNPDKSFGNIAKTVSQLWKTLTAEQKQDYAMHAKNQTQQLERQLELHTGHQKYVCPKCNRKISHHKNYTNHVKECGQKFTCTLCDSVFMERRNLTKHVSAVHEKVKTYTCKSCQKGFAYRKDLLRHMVQHSGELPFQCPTCNLKFSWKCNLRRHQAKAKHFSEVTNNDHEGGNNKGVSESTIKVEVEEEAALIL